MATVSSSAHSFILKPNAHILVVRPDRLGDVLLSTPVLEVLRRTYPKAKLAVLAQSRVAPILRGLSSIDEIIEYDPSGRHQGFSGFLKLIQELRVNSFDLAVVLHAPARIAWALFFSRIPVRLGPLSKWFSLLIYNQRMRQSRSKVEMHEADYNLQLLQPLGIFVGHRTVPTQASVSNEAAQEVKIWMQDNGVFLDSRSWIAVHPGMGGSALNWPEAHYIELVRKLLDEDFGVVLTAGPSEEDILNRFKNCFKDHPYFKSFGGLSASDVQRLASLYSKMDLVVAPSTGPLHLAVAMKTKVLTFFPPIQVQSAKRWGPYEVLSNPDETASVVFVPQVICGQEYRCLGERCGFFPCMNRISVDQVMENVRKKKDQIHNR